MNLKTVVPTLCLGAALAGSHRLHAGQSTALPNPSPGNSDAATVQASGSEPDPAGTERRRFWSRNFSSPPAYQDSVQPNRERFRRMLGAIDPRVAPVPIESAETNQIARTDSLVWEMTRWPVFAGVWGEGVRLRPKTPPVAFIVALPDADQTPEMLAGLAPGLTPERQFARRLAEQGCEVLVPVLVDRREPQPPGGAAAPGRSVSRRDLICREAFPLGRHLLGYEVQKVLAAVDVLLAGASKAGSGNAKIGVAGWGEGGLIAFYSAALDPRIAATLVSGSFDSPHPLADEPLSRTLFGFRWEFGDAEIATLIAPRGLVIEYSVPPGRESPETGATEPAQAPPDYETVEAEFDRARLLLKPGESKGLIRFTLISGNEGMATGPGSDRALTALLKDLGLNLEQVKPAGVLPKPAQEPPSPSARQQRQFDELQQFTRQLSEKIDRGR